MHYTKNNIIKLTQSSEPLKLKLFIYIFKTLRWLYNIILWLRNPCYVILFVITSNNMPQSSLITLTYHLVLNGSPLWRTSPSFLLSSYCSFDIYSLSSHLLECDLPRLDLVRDLSLLLKPYNCKPMTGSSYSQPQPWSIACVIAKKRPWSTQNLRSLEPQYGWYDAWLIGRSKYGSLVFGQPNRCKKLTIRSTIDSANGGLDC